MKQLAVKLERDEFLADDEEYVFVRQMMFEDVYYQEQEELPPRHIFDTRWLTRKDDATFWVIRQGEFMPRDQFWGLSVIRAKTADLDAVTPSVEHYSEIPTICLEGAYDFNLNDDVVIPLDARRATISRIYTWVSGMKSRE